MKNLTAKLTLSLAILHLVACNNSSFKPNDSVEDDSGVLTNDSLRYELFAVGNGYGFNILKKEKIYIHQPVIPCLQGFQFFPTKDGARKMAGFLIKKLQDQNFRFLIEIQDVDSILGDATIAALSAIQPALPDTSTAIDFIAKSTGIARTTNEISEIAPLKDIPLKEEWRKLRIVPFGKRGGMMSFTIKNGIYMGGGDHKDLSGRDLWRYDAIKDYWTCLADLPGGRIIGGVAFSVSGKGYLGLGGVRGGNSKSFKKDFYQYDPDKNRWTRKKDFPVGARVDASSFVIGDKAYVGTGYDEDYFKDIYEYNPATDLWSRVADFGGGLVSASIGISTGTNGFIIAGDHVPENKKFAYEYIPQSNSWKRLKDFPGRARYFLTGYNIDSERFIAGAGGAEGGEIRFRDFFLYDITTDRWSSLPDYPSSSLGNTRPIGGNVNGKIFMGTGFNGNYLDEWSAFEYYFPVRTDTGIYNETTCYPLQYNGQWEVFQECNENNCYIGIELKSNQSLGNLCYSSRIINSLPNVSLPGKQVSNYKILPRNFTVITSKQPGELISLRLFFTRAEMEKAIHSCNLDNQSAFTLNDVRVLQCNEASPDTEPSNNKFGEGSYTFIKPQWYSYGFKGETLVAEFPVTSLHSEFYLLLPAK